MVLGYPYANFRLSDALDSGEVATIGASSNLNSATLSGDDVTIAGETVACHQLASNVRTFADNREYAEINRTSIADTTTKTKQGRSTAEVTATFYVDYAANGTYQKFMQDSKGTRLLYVERETGKKYVQMVEIGSANEDTSDEGDLVIEVTFRNAGPEPSWS